MLKVECESCKAPYQVDERRVPPTGLKMRCPKCGHTFLVTDPSKGAPADASGGVKPPPPPKKATMMGLAPKIPPTAGRPAPPAPAPAAPPPNMDMGLPAVKASPAKSARETARFADKPTAPAMPQVTAPSAAATPFGGLDDLDLPAVADDAGLPATVKRAPGRPGARPVAAKPAPAPAPPAPAPAPPAPAAPPPSPFDFEVDLPAVPSAAPSPGFGTAPGVGAAPFGPPAGFGSIDLPATKSAPAKAPPAPSFDLGASFGDLPSPKASGFGDLPSPKGGGFGDLPAPKGGGFGDLPAPKGGGFGDLPSPKGGGFGDLPSPKGGGFGDLPAPKGGGFSDLPMAARGSGPGGGFGEIDLPSLQNDLPHYDGGTAALPAPMGAGAHLPSPVGGGAHLPSPVGAGAHLPSPVGAGAHLPSPMGAGAHLPMASSPGAHLPSPMGPNAHLPMASSPGAHLPSPMQFDSHMPQTVSDDRLLPNKMGGPSPIAFGELDLPLVGGPDPLASSRPGGFGDVALPGDMQAIPSLPSGTPPLSAPPASVGGMGFGEVDLGGGDDGGMPLGPPPAASGSAFAFQEASLEAAPMSRKSGPAPGRTRERAVDTGPSRLPKILGIGVAVLVLGGAALQLTPVGAFGNVWISDKLHAKENIAAAAAKGDFARKKTATDTFPAGLSAADELFDAKKKAPRSRPLGAYAAFVEYMNEVRFGLDAARAARVNTFVVDVPPDVEVPYLASARAAQAAQAGDWAKAKAAVDVAIAKDPKDGIQHELAILKGEIALAQRDATGALAAFTTAHASGASARTYFGMARAHAMARAYPKAKEAVEGTLKATPTHAGALTLRAQLAWQMERDDVGALKDLGVVLDPGNRKNLGASELGFALTTKGWIMFARDRAGDARAAFDEAVKIDPRNVSALVGQGEVLYADGRYTEASTRFDEATQKEPLNIAAVVGSAKSQIALEHLSDAKTALVAARTRAPKDMSVALWLARCEQALGNRKAAEELYTSALDLADPQNPDAIDAYAAYAKFLAGQGKTAEAAAKLEQARAKLPDTAALQRAFGEVAVSQGQFDQALEHFQNALQKNPNDLGTRFRLGQTYRRMHKLDLAAKALDEVAAIDKDYPNMALERGLLFEESGDVQKALDQFNTALQKAPNDPDLQLRVGAAYVAVGDVDKGLPFLNKVRELRPNSAEAHHFVGRAYLKRGGLEQVQAMRYLQRAVQLDPNKADYHLYVAWAANEASPAQLTLARAEAEKALELDRTLADAYWQRGVVERREQQINDAIKDLRKALELKPSRFEAHAALAEAYEDKNDVAGALVEWQRALAGDDKPSFWRFRYGKILADRNQNAEAAKHLAYAVEHGKSEQPRPGWLFVAAFEGGEALRKTGQKKDACELYHLFMELAPSSSPDRRDAIKATNDLGCPVDR